MSTTEASSNGIPAPPPPPPMPGQAGAVNVPTYKETKQKNDEIKKSEAAKSSIQDSQFANLPDKLMNTMKREKKPFTYTPLSVGDNGKLDLNQIKSPKMKKRLMANMRDEEEQDENKIESIDSCIENNKNQDKLLDRELSSPTPFKQTNQPSFSNQLDSTSFSPSVQTKPSLVVPLSALNNDDYQNSSYNSNGYQPLNQPSTLNYDFKRPLSPDEKLDQMLNEQLNRPLNFDLNNNYTPSFYNQKPQQHYGNVKPKKINIFQELADERNFNCVPSTTTTTPSQYSNDYNRTPKLWSNNTQEYTIPVQIQNSKPQYYSNPQLDYQSATSSATPTKSSYSPYERSQSQQGSYQIPVINENKTTSQTAPTTKNAPIPPQRQQSLNRSYEEREIPVQYEEPIQSRSFKILQKLTADIEDEIDKLKVLDQQNRAVYQQQKDPLEDKLPAYFGTLNHIEQPRERRSERRIIPIQVDDNYHSSSSFKQPEYHPKNEQNWFLNSNHISSSMDSSTPSSHWSSSIDWTPQIPASKQPQITPPPRYQGSNIPSRTFRILQMLANEDDW